MPPEPVERPTITLAYLKSWEGHGATWRALEVADDHAIVQLCTCYGEPVDLVRGDEPELIAFLRERPRSEFLN